MTKYFDLLRAHQDKKGRSLTESSNQPIVASSESPPTDNPYSKGKDETLPEDFDADTQLISEDDLSSSGQESVRNPIDLEELLIEDEQSDDIPDSSTLQTNISTPPSFEHANNPNFNISNWLHQISKNIQSVFQQAESDTPTDLSSFDEPLMSLLQHIDDDNKLLDALELEISRNIKHICDAECSVNDLVEKSIMMMLYTIKISSRLKLQTKETLQHTVAAMLHHIGMATVPHEIRHKSGKLNKSEIASIRKAPENAVSYIESCNPNNQNIILAASQSSERYDGSGSTGLKGHSIAWVARVVGLLSMFEALIHFRPYRQRLLPRDAIRELVNHHKKAFDPELLKALIEAVSLYPVGTFVQLNTGEVGQVILVHSKFPLRPVVYINMDKDGNTITEREINLKQQPNLMIQKCMYEESIGNPEDNTH